MTDKNNSVDQIRDILFGEQTKKIDKKFAQLELDISQQFNGIKSQLEALNKHLTDSLAAAAKSNESSSDQMMQDHDKQLSTLEKNISDKIVDTEASIINELQTQVDDINDRLTQKKDLSALLKQLADEVAK